MTKQQWTILGGLALAFGLYALTRDGGLIDVPPDVEFDPVELQEGTLVELEHTTDKGTAKTIAKHHLLEDDLYYQKLAAIH